jgi:anti-sigma-K factor RskA
MKSRDEIRDDLPLYALGALDTEERRAVDAALAQDVELAGELREWTELIGLMALEAPEVPPPDLKARLMARVRGDSEPRRVPPAEPAAAPVRRVETDEKVARRRIHWAVPVAIAALALLALASFREIGWRVQEADWRAARDRELALAGELQDQLTAARADFARVSVALGARESDLASLRSALSEAKESLSILNSRGLNLVSLKETKDAPPAEGHILLSPPTGRALFYAFDLPQVPADKAYELWWITEKEGPVMAGVFRPDERGVGKIEAKLPSGAGAITAAAVTVEVASGVPKPQGPMVLLGALEKS